MAQAKLGRVEIENAIKIPNLTRLTVRYHDGAAGKILVQRL